MHTDAQIGPFRVLRWVRLVSFRELIGLVTEVDYGQNVCFAPGRSQPPDFSMSIRDSDFLAGLALIGKLIESHYRGKWFGHNDSASKVGQHA